MKRNFFSDFSEYLEYVCSRMIPLVPQGGRRTFFRGVDSEFLQGLRSQAQFPCVIREGIGWQETSVQYMDDNGLISKQRNVSFIVADGYSMNDDAKGMDMAMDTCEMIGEEILKCMDMDAGRVPCLEGFDFSMVTTSCEVNREQRYVMVQFKIAVTSVLDSCLSPEIWNWVM